MFKAKQFHSDGTAIQVGGLKTSDAKITVANTAIQFDAVNDRIVEIQDYSGSGGWFVISASSNPTNPSADNGNAYLPAFGTTRPFILKKGMYIEASTTFNIRALDIEV